MTAARSSAIAAWLRMAPIATVAAAMTLASASAPGAGQDVTAESANPFVELGLPRIAVTINNEAFEGAPTQLPAGRYVLSVTNAFEESIEETEGAALLQLPAGLSNDDFAALVRDAATEWPPAWYYETALAGGAYAALGETAYAVVDLAAGDWALWSEALGSPQAPVPIAVTGTPPADRPTPTEDVSAELSDFEVAFSAPLRAGPQVIEIVNTGRQPHFLFFGGVPDGTTVAEAQAAFEAFWDPESAPPPPFSFADTPEYFSTGDQSPGATAWYAVEIPEGTVVVACFLTDPETGQAHAMLGMTEIFHLG